MFTYCARLRTVEGDEVNDRIRITEERQPSGVVSVSVSALARPRSQTMGTIHPELGLLVELETDAVIEAYMANYRSSEFWCAPAFGADVSTIPDETQLLLCRLKGGEYLVLLPVVNEKYKSVICGTPEGRIAVRCFSRYSRLYDCRGLSFLYARGTHPHTLIETCVREALRLLNNGTKHRTERRYPEVMEYLGWCSWDSMQIRVNEEGILEKCEEFKTKRIPVKWAIIDDMWGEVRDFYGETYTHCTECYAGIPESLLTLKARGYTLAVLSNKQDVYVKELVKILLPEGLVASAAGQTDLPKKPDPTVPLMIASSLGFAPSETAFIGDSEVDVLTGKNAGMLTVGCSWGYRDREVLVESQADFVLDRPSELVEIFG